MKKSIDMDTTEKESERKRERWGVIEKGGERTRRVSTVKMLQGGKVK